MPRKKSGKITDAHKEVLLEDGTKARVGIDSKKVQGERQSNAAMYTKAQIKNKEDETIKFSNGKTKVYETVTYKNGVKKRRLKSLHKLVKGKGGAKVNKRLF